MNDGKGEWLMYASIQNNILENIAANFVEIYQKKSLSKIQSQASILSVECGEWCEDCLKVFVDVDALTKNADMTTDDQKKTISYFRRGVCRGACVCNVNKLEMTNDVVFLTDNTVVADVDVDVITQKLQTFLATQYKSDGFKDAVDKNTVSQIVNDINMRLKSTIDQSVATYQTVKLEGAGSIKNVSVDVMVRAVMVTIISNKSSVESIDKFAQNIFEKITQEVQKSFTAELKATVNRYKPQLIVMFSLLCVAIVIQVLLFFYQVYAISR